jgi:phosphoenolpyruvate carboxylase
VTELSTRRPLVRDGAELSPLARKELDIVDAAARAVATLGNEAVPTYIISMCQSVSDMLEAALLLKEAGLLDLSSETPHVPVGIVPLFETIDDLQRGSAILEAALDVPL